MSWGIVSTTRDKYPCYHLNKVNIMLTGSKQMLFIITKNRHRKEEKYFTSLAKEKATRK